MTALHNSSVEIVDQFNSNDFPLVVNQLVILRTALASLPSANKVDIVISYLKNHCIKNEWIESNQPVCEKMVAGLVAVSHIENFFDGCKNNKSLLADFEGFVEKNFNSAKADYSLNDGKVLFNNILPLT
jgi:histidyl-tRNA synthetase